MAVQQGARLRFILTAFLTAVFCLSVVPALRAEQPAALPDHVIKTFGERPAIAAGPLPDNLKKAVQTAFVDSVSKASWGDEQTAALAEIARSKDVRLGWMISDMMRFAVSPHIDALLLTAASGLFGKELDRQNSWGSVTDHLIAWDIPAPPDYLEVKRAIFTGLIPGWDKIF
ncbi:MAG: hypothetical protein R3287_14740, partial [Anderseniella sp.]|nr:hypothetical protein [Anderseniella sp.]